MERSMERHEILEMMAALKMLGMRMAFDEVLANGIKRQHAAQQIIGDLLAAEIAEKHARSIRYQVGAAKLPLSALLTSLRGIASRWPRNSPTSTSLAARSTRGWYGNWRSAGF